MATFAVIDYSVFILASDTNVCAYLDSSLCKSQNSTSLGIVAKSSSRHQRKQVDRSMRGGGIE